MIARCDWCDEESGKVTGQRVTGRLEGSCCFYCNGPLRHLRRGEWVSQTVDAAHPRPAISMKEVTP
jgi:uncharacterized protein with PIN domain